MLFTSAISYNQKLDPLTLLQMITLIVFYPYGFWLRCAFIAQMAGMTGFEPVDDGVKVRCLTAWLHPYKTRHL